MSKEQEVKHTELPWQVNGNGIFPAKGSSNIAICSRKTFELQGNGTYTECEVMKANAEFIVTACNSHYALKKENEELRAYANSVERLLKDRQTKLINDKPNATSSEEQAQYDLLIVELALILKQLQTIKV